MLKRRFRDQLYPSLEPYETGMLKLDSLHSMYWEQSGSPTGIPIFFLHGGPGAGSTPIHRRFFDPAAYRIIIHDQRGAGRSTPLGTLTDNTTQHLVSDINTLADHLGIEKFWLFGGSWGSTLALAYAIETPKRCLGLIIRGVFLGRPKEVDWFLYGLRNVFPEAWRHFVSIINDEERNDILRAFTKRLLDPDPEIYLSAARAWSRYEGSCSTLNPSPETVAAFGEDTVAYALARIETHYFSNENFLSKKPILDQVNRLHNMPCTIIHGRYDMICPIITADELHRAWPNSNLVIVPDAGHSALDPGIRSALINATEKLKTEIA